ncbi:hypothetical protein Kpol_495p14 [Vanderwaltozyma polyspora DSM 70294]|uniref:Carbon catabolite-derepressing protein kinase n=1 Tax=Vanderwaltozyma polyspora (strain ATCC 22028 / DSM 70294 / BCRC 21397 / CBS 2163 / NBRC 10782 / NRRL Y-8283 / UCD 57-17) TaxID=436907 RepID=A7TNZ1_VANPO|nr:uncharacterized protein Kpol_495p14 [Vanderwaltozyma polyspora DSM 70294]EDO16016.1 hypothetical protein Kpol_495p14 [Vanderwaltozyma polyspora DSM 70294]
MGAEEHHTSRTSSNGSGSHKSHNHHRHHSRRALSDGSRIGNYQIVKTLGEGSFGKVKLAFHVTTGQKVALKIINRKVLSKSDMQGRIEREIAYLRLLRHPHIIRLYDVIKSKDEIIMIIEYAHHELFDYIVQRDKMSENEARKFFQQIISAVDYCHRHMIVHRDLKPENLLLDEHYNVKITDFGLSNIMTDGNFLKTSCGSPNYAAPEVISGKLYAGPEVDVWSCGVILYVMLCRRLPFDDESIPILFKNISNGIYTLPNFLSDGAASLIKKMLIVNPINRISISEIMQDEWFKVDLPTYLLSHETAKQEDEPKKECKIDNDEPIDDEAVTILSQTMNYEKEEIHEALKSKSTDNPSHNEIKEAYLLIKENQNLIRDLQCDKTKSNELDTFLAQSPPSFQMMNKKEKLEKSNNPLGYPDSQRPIYISSSKHRFIKEDDNQQRTYLPRTFSDEENTPDSTVAILPTSLPQIHRANVISQGLVSPSNAPSAPSKKSRTKWHFGIRSRSYPLDVMSEIYAALQTLGAEWAKPSEEELWTIKVRWKYDCCSVTNLEHVPDVMKMIVQLFQIETNNYLVDFKFDGWEYSDGSLLQHSTISDEEMGAYSAYPFLRLATRLIMELAVNSRG